MAKAAPLLAMIPLAVQGASSLSCHVLFSSGLRDSNLIHSAAYVADTVLR